MQCLVTEAPIPGAVSTLAMPSMSIASLRRVSATRLIEFVMDFIMKDDVRFKSKNNCAGDHYET